MNFKVLSLTTTLFLFFCSSNFAQTKLTILYKNGKVKGNLDDYLKPNTNSKWNGNYKIDEFTISDSITYYESGEIIEEKEEFSLATFKKARKKKVLGKAFAANTIYCNYIKGICLNENVYKDDNYLVKDSIKNKQNDWALTEDKKVVLGYNCNKATRMNENNEVEVVAWYFDFKCNYSSTGDTTLPGTILETYYPKNNNLISAIDLQIETSPILVPKMGTLVTADEYKKILKNKKG